MLFNHIQPSIEVFSLRIDEPITAITDLVLAAVCFYAFVRIKRHEAEGRIKWYFKYYFLTLGLGALAGGILGHAFYYSLSPMWKLVSWVFTLASVGLIAHALVEMSRPLFRPAFSRMVARMNILILLLALSYTLWTLAFSAVQYYTMFGMIVVVGSLSYLIYQRTRSRGMLKLMLAVGFGIVSALIFTYEWGLGPWLNHMDISHLILSYSALTLYKGASLILTAPVNLL